MAGASTFPAEWSLELSVEPASEPVTLDEFKAHARILGNDEDSALESIIASARQAVEVFTRRSFIRTTWVKRLDRFPSDRTIWLERPPLESVTSVQYIDEAGATQTLAASEYDVDTASEPGRIVLAPEKSWPSTESQRINAVTITYRAGYGTSGSDVPAAIRQAVLLLAGHWEANREQVSPVHLRAIPYGVERVVWAYRWGDYR